MSVHQKYLSAAIAEAAKGMKAGEGGPFGAVIVRHRRIIGRGHNTVIKSRDPTAHAEVNAIRNACGRTGDHHLTDAVLYTNFEPCPMCLSAAYWADIRKIYYCAGSDAAERAGFRDRQLYEELVRPAGEREISLHRIELEEMEALLEEWEKKDDKVLY